MDTKHLEPILNYFRFKGHKYKSYIENCITIEEKLNNINIKYSLTELDDDGDYDYIKTFIENVKELDNKKLKITYIIYKKLISRYTDFNVTWNENVIKIYFLFWYHVSNYFKYDEKNNKFILLFVTTFSATRRGYYHKIFKRFNTKEELIYYLTEKKITYFEDIIKNITNDNFNSKVSSYDGILEIIPKFDNKVLNLNEIIDFSESNFR